MVRALALFSVVAIASVSAAASFYQTGGYVSGYHRSNGTYVNSYHRSSRNLTVRDNYSYYGNSNPYTGSIGTNRYYRSPSSEYYRRW